MDNENNVMPPQEEQEGGRVIPVNLTKEMEQSFLDYSMSVIVQRALPDVRDGLKPVHRRMKIPSGPKSPTASAPIP